MDVFVSNLPETISRGELMRLLLPFDRQVKAKLYLHQTKTGGLICFAVCNFASERLALKAIKKLNGFQLLGYALTAREYRYRSYSNERRALGWRNRRWLGKERRGRERRNGSLPDDTAYFFPTAAVVETVDEEQITVAGYSGFATKFT